MQTVERECVYRREKERERKRMVNQLSPLNYQLKNFVQLTLTLIIFLHIINDKIID